MSSASIIRFGLFQLFGSTQSEELTYQTNRPFGVGAVFAGAGAAARMMGDLD